LIAAIFYHRYLAGGMAGTMLAVTIIFGFLAFVGFTHCFKSVYTWWMKFANLLHKLVTAILFGACYLFLVPLFYPAIWILDPLGLRKNRGSESFWVRRRNRRLDLASLRRMG
jgi:hypothetical protein